MNELQPAEFDLPVAGGLHVAAFGERTIPERAVLVVHGITGNHRNVAFLSQALADSGFYAVAPDLRGRGRSAKPPHGYGLPFHADDLLSLLDALELPSAHLVGHSLGAMIGLYLGVLHPARLVRLVLIDAGGVVPPDGAQALGRSLGRIGRDYESEEHYMGAVREAMEPILGGWSDFWEGVYRYDIAPQPGGTVRSSIPQFVLQQELATNNLVRVRNLPGLLRVPTLIARAGSGILGPSDGMILSAEEAERLHREMPESELVEIPGVNHYSIAASAELAAHLVRFLSSATG